MANQTPAFIPTVTKRQIRARGPVDSIVVNDSLDEVHSDLIALSDYINRAKLDIDEFKAINTTEILTLRERVAELETQTEVSNRFGAFLGSRLVYSTDFRQIAGFDTTVFPESRRLRVDSSYGVATVPYNEYRSRFHILDPRTDTIFVPTGINPVVTALDEGNGEVEVGTPLNAFNGQNESFWARSIRFPLSTDRDSVTMQFDFDVPLTFAQKTNVLSLNPYPLGLVDIVNVQYSTDATDPTTTLPGFPSGGIKNAKATKLYFAPLSITKLRITFRQRRWIERDEQKVFTYGAQEIDLGLVEFDKTDDPSILNNNGLVIKVDAPTGYTFASIRDFYTSPDWDTASTDTGVYVQIYTDSGLTNQIWDSFTDPHPRSTTVTLATSTTSLYLLVVLKYIQAQQNTPVLTQLGMAYTVTSS